MTVTPSDEINRVAQAGLSVLLALVDGQAEGMFQWNHIFKSDILCPCY